MPHFRTDPLTGRRVVIAQGRAGRPNEFVKLSPQELSTTRLDDCPFCAGNEAQTPPALMQLGVGNDWRCRVAPNKYPVCAPPEEHGRPNTLAGAHEVVIECRDHLQNSTQLGKQGLANVLGVWAARLNHWRTDERFPFRMVFRNVGPSAGASLSHLHSQLVALPQISQQQELEHRNVLATDNPVSAWRQWLNAQLDGDHRLIAQSESFVVFCPRVPRGPFEFSVMPQQRSPWFEDDLSEPAAQQQLAALLQPVLERLEQRILPAGYNMVLHTAPNAAEYADLAWWRLEVLPRTASLAGFELGTGVYLSTMSPEDAAAELRG